MKYAMLAITVSSLLATGFIVGRASERYTDKLAGRAAFNLRRQGDDVFMQPMITPVFKLAWLKGPKPVESEVAQCSVWGREVHKDEQQAQIITVIVLRCDQTEYAVSEVDFVFDSNKAEKLMPSPFPAPDSTPLDGKEPEKRLQ